ncbi:MAG: SiaB family protein kinase [Candidatus Cloacimonetes bacterium]|nr:SiaB family protein kinase [Candidatus Cloacimonadota bacterium]
MNSEIPIDCFNIFTIMDKSDVIFSYKGPVTQDILVAVGDSIKEKFRSNDVGNTIVKKIFAIFIEEAQNVLKYSFDKELQNDDQSSGIGLIGVGKKEEHYYFVFSGNVMKKSDVEKIKTKIDHINSLKDDELRKYYKESRKNGTLTEQGGAGLGFIDMARKSGRPLSYGFKELDENRAFFEVLIKIPC